jgi:hypothetical protein
VLIEARHAVAFDIAGRYAYVATQPDGITDPSELLVFTLSDPGKPALVGGQSLPASVSDLTYSQGHVFTVSAGGLSVVEVTDPARPMQIASLPVGGQYWHIAAESENAYLLEPNGTLHVVDVSRPDRPAQVGWLDKAREDDIRPNNAMDLIVSRGVAYVLHHQWLQAIDVRDSARPAELTWTSVPGGGLMDMALELWAVEVVSQSGGLHIYRLRRPPLPYAIWLPFAARE